MSILTKVVAPPADEIEHALIRIIKQRHPELVHVLDPNALSAYRNGAILFDVPSPEDRIHRFRLDHQLDAGKLEWIGGSLPNGALLTVLYDPLKAKRPTRHTEVVDR
jgi:hypothetical protein